LDETLNGLEIRAWRVANVDIFAPFRLERAQGDLLADISPERDDERETPQQST
jgi:hypothetical protein